jgi:hypothetical protein
MALDVDLAVGLTLSLAAELSAQMPAQAEDCRRVRLAAPVPGARAEQA